MLKSVTITLVLIFNGNLNQNRSLYGTNRHYMDAMDTKLYLPDESKPSLAPPLHNYEHNHGANLINNSVYYST